jgi:hypothetical protein
MTKQLLVPLRGGDRVVDGLPYLRDVAHAGTTVVFLVPFGANRFLELADQLLTLSSGLPAAFDEGTGPDQQAKGGQGIYQAGEKLRQRGVAIKVKFYSGSLRRLVRECTETEPVKWVIMRPARSRIMRRCYAIAAALRVVRSSAPAPIFLMFDPNGIAWR